MKRRAWFIFILLIIGLTALIPISIYNSHAFQQCVCAGEQDYHRDADQEQHFRFVIPIYIGVDCVGAFLEAHNGAITALASIIVALFTGTLWVATNGMLKASAQQSIDTQHSIAESASAASAMERVAQHFAENVAIFRERSALQIRAYVTVIVFNGIYQEREKGIPFEAQPLMLNTGHTPAHRVYYKASARILSVPLPPEFDFPLPEMLSGGAALGPQQNFIMNAFVDELCDDAELDTVKRGIGKALYVWGIVCYEDAFGESQHTKFCHFLRWIPNPPQGDRIVGTYIGKYRECT